jgi:hypothetical protein
VKEVKKMSASELQQKISEINEDPDLTAQQKTYRIQRAKELNDAQEAADAENAKRTGKGTRLLVGQTRGKSSMVILYEAFDTDKPETLPTNLEEFVNLTKIGDEKELAGLLVDGFNAHSYSEASDPVGEFINPMWPDAVKLSFKLAVKNTAKAAGMTFEEAANVIKPGVEKKFAADSAAPVVENSEQDSTTPTTVNA